MTVAWRKNGAIGGVTIDLLVKVADEGDADERFVCAQTWMVGSVWLPRCIGCVACCWIFWRSICRRS
ncbi:protein of unknown function [Paraburkholderia dioscoreae]|uniref:Uncharacterized protein n=1 Tax=Paraburkholderia dioscoreae TaxID=2604047 RepID=A0A5Q4Z5S9_9BURK|nr:protein of unknown function [Paraburkholderia dioscoreae]